MLYYAILLSIRQITMLCAMQPNVDSRAVLFTADIMIAVGLYGGIYYYVLSYQCYL